MYYIDFNDVFENIDNQVEFNSEWANSTGYMDNAVWEPVSEPVKFEDNAGRKGVILPLLLAKSPANVVIFQRYAGGNVIVSNEAPEVRRAACLQGDITADAGVIANAIELMNGAIGTEFEKMAKDAFSKDGSAFLDVAAESIRVCRGEVASVTLPTNVAKALIEKGLVVGAKRHGKAVGIKVEDGEIILNDVKYGWEEYTPIIGDEIRYVQNEASAKVILSTLAA
jgi:hypothetical protein